jgi:hypothetical protein
MNRVLHKSILHLVVGVILSTCLAMSLKRQFINGKTNPKKFHFTDDPNDSLDTFLSKTTSFRESLAENIS